MRYRPRTPYLRTDEAAHFLRLAPHTLDNMRWQGTGPKFRKHGGRVMYVRKELERWSNSNRRQTSSGKRE